MNVALQHMRYCAQWLIIFVACGITPLSAQQLQSKKAESNSTHDLNKAQSMLAQERAVFIANNGQVADSDGKSRSDVRYTADLGTMTVYFMADRVCYVINDPRDLKKAEAQTAHATITQKNGESPDREPDGMHVFRFDMKMLGSRPDVAVYGEEKGAATHTYYKGASVVQSEAYRKVVYRNIYDGVDLVYYLSGQGLKYDFVVSPGADHRAIRWEYEGAERISLSKKGTLQIQTSLGVVEEDIPLTYEVSADGKRTVVPNAQFALDGMVCRFDVQRVNPDHKLVIDPILVWSTYYGGSTGPVSTTDECTSVAVDGNDNVIVVGWTATNNFPEYLGYQWIFGGGNDAFVVKFDPDGVVLWATYYGGNNDDQAYGVAVGTNDSIYVVGLTNSWNFPVASAFQGSIGGGYDAFIIHFTPTGGRNWASYCGGSNNDYGMDVGISSSNVPMFTGTTYSSNFPLASQIDGTLNDIALTANGDAFIVAAYKGTQYFGSYFGGDGDDRGMGIIVDGNDNATITGSTTGPETGSGYPVLGYLFPVNNPWQSVYGGAANDAFLTKVNVPLGFGGATPLWSTYFGSNGDDIAEDIAMIASGSSIAITGYSTSASLTAGDCFANTTTANYDVIVYVFDYVTGFPVKGRFYGSTHANYGMDIARIGTTVDEILVTGYSLGGNLPIEEEFQARVGSIDAFIACFDHAACQVEWATYYGTTGNEYGYGICSDGNNRAIAVGRADVTGLPMRDGPYLTSTTVDGFVAVFDESIGRFPTFVGGSSTDRAEDLALDNNNNVYITGWTRSSNFPTTTGAHQTSRAGSQDAFIARFSNMGDREWITYYGGNGSSNDVGTGIAVLGSDIAVVGYTQSTNNIATAGTWAPIRPDAGSGYDGFLVRFSTSGVRQWGTYIGGIEDDFAMDVAFDYSGIVVTGYTRTDFPDTVFASAGAPQLWFGGGAFDAFVSKFNTNDGSRQWSTFAGGTGDDRGYGLCLEGNGRIVMVGGTSDGSSYPQYGGAASYTGTNWDAIVTKYYSNGSSPWSLVYGGNDHDTAFAVTSQTSGLYGRIYVTGTTKNTGLQTFPVSPGSYGFTGNNDMFIIRFDSLGTRWRARVIDQSDDHEHADAVVAYDDNVIVAGQTASTNLSGSGILGGGILQSNISGTTDAVIIGLDQYFSYTDGTYFGGTAHEAGTGLAIDSKGRVVLGGWSSSSSFSAYDTDWAFQAGNGGGEDAFISRFSLDMTRIAKQSNEELLPSEELTHSYRCYPNPTTGIMHLEGEIESGELLDVTVTDALGRTVLSFKEKPAGTNYSGTVDVSQLAAGSYVLMVRSGKAPAVGLPFIKR